MFQQASSGVNNNNFHLHSKVLENLSFEEKKEIDKALLQFREGEKGGLNREKLSHTKLWSLRTSRSGRLLYVYHEGKIYVLHYTATHDYDKALASDSRIRRLCDLLISGAKTPSELGFVAYEPSLPEVDQVNDAPVVVDEDEGNSAEPFISPVYVFQNSFFTLKEQQEEIIGSDSSILVQGSAGAGKTSMTLPLLEEFVKKNQSTFVLTGSKGSSDELQKDYRLYGSDDVKKQCDAKKIKFISLEEFISLVLPNNIKDSWAAFDLYFKPKDNKEILEKLREACIVPNDINKPNQVSSYVKQLLHYELCQLAPFGKYRQMNDENYVKHQHAYFDFERYPHLRGEIAAILEKYRSSLKDKNLADSYLSDLSNISMPTDFQSLQHSIIDEFQNVPFNIMYFLARRNDSIDQGRIIALGDDYQAKFEPKSGIWHKQRCLKAALNKDIEVTKLRASHRCAPVIQRVSNVFLQINANFTGQSYDVPQSSTKEKKGEAICYEIEVQQHSLSDYFNFVKRDLQRQGHMNENGICHDVKIFAEKKEASAIREALTQLGISGYIIVDPRDNPGNEAKCTIIYDRMKNYEFLNAALKSLQSSGRSSKGQVADSLDVQKQSITNDVRYTAQCKDWYVRTSRARDNMILMLYATEESDALREELRKVTSPGVCSLSSAAPTMVSASVSAPKTAHDFLDDLNLNLNDIIDIYRNIQDMYASPEHFFWPLDFLKELMIEDTDIALSSTVRKNITALLSKFVNETISSLRPEQLINLPWDKLESLAHRELLQLILQNETISADTLTDIIGRGNFFLLKHFLSFFKDNTVNTHRLRTIFSLVIKKYLPEMLSSSTDTDTAVTLFQEEAFCNSKTRENLTLMIESFISPDRDIRANFLLNSNEETLSQIAEKLHRFLPNQSATKINKALIKKKNILSLNQERTNNPEPFWACIENNEEHADNEKIREQLNAMSRDEFNKPEFLSRLLASPKARCWLKTVNTLHDKISDIGLNQCIQNYPKILMVLMHLNKNELSLRDECLWDKLPVEHLRTIRDWASEHYEGFFLLLYLFDRYFKNIKWTSLQENIIKKIKIINACTEQEYINHALLDEILNTEQLNLLGFSVLKHENLIRLQDRNGDQILGRAVTGIKNKALEFLLELGADPDQHIASFGEADNITALQLASEAGYTEIVELLLKHNANATIVRENGVTPLFMACQLGHLEVAKLLLKKDPRVDFALPCAGISDKTTLLLIACQLGHFDIVKFLLDEGADVNLANVDDATPLSVACECSHVDIVKLLLARGANVNIANIEGITPLYKACCINKSKNIEIVKLLLNENPDLNLEDSNPSLKTVTSSPLGVACKYDFKEIVQLILNHAVTRGLSMSPGVKHGLNTCGLSEMGEDVIALVKILAEKYTFPRDGRPTWYSLYKPDDSDDCLPMRSPSPD